jgi:transposase
MRFIGVDLHKHSISVCVLVREANRSRIVARRSLRCDQPKRIREFFASWAPFQAVVEATSSYEWFVQLVEPLAKRVALAHPKKLRIIAESTRKTDKLDAQVLAEFLALDMIPPAHRPAPRLRERNSPKPLPSPNGKLALV